MEHTASKLEWLRNRPDFQNNPEKQRLLRLFENLTQRVGDKLDPLLPWLAREVKKGRITHSDAYGDPGRLYTKEPALDEDGEQLFNPLGHPQSLKPAYEELPLTGADLSHLADWYHSNHESRRGVDLMQHDWPSIKGKVGEWDDYLKAQQELAEQRQAEGGEVVYDYGDGWTLRRLGEDHLGFEGDAMGHCVGGYGYGDKVASGDTQIYSLRDPKHQPHVTMELETTHHRNPMTGELSTDEMPTPEDYWSAEHAVPERARVVQIQGKGNEIPNPEYQARMKQFFGTMTPEDRPTWDSDDNYYNDYRELPTYEGQDIYNPYGYADNGGYDPHGDYGLADPGYVVNYDDAVESTIKDDPHVRWSDHSDANPDAMDAVYKAALHNNAIPEFAKAVQRFNDDQSEDYFDWRNYNRGIYGEEIQDPELEELEYPNERYETPEEHSEAFYNQEAEWEAEHSGLKASNYFRDLISPHWVPNIGENGGSFQNEFGPNITLTPDHPGYEAWQKQRLADKQQQLPPATAHARATTPHPRFGSGEECYCPWGDRRDEERLGSRTAGKMEWLEERPDKFAETPRGQDALKKLRQLVDHEGDKVDPLTPWLWREIKKNRLATSPTQGPDEWGHEPEYLFDHDIGHLADWYHSNSPTRRGVDIMQKQFDDPDNPGEKSIHHHINAWNDELKQRMEETRANENGEVVHDYGDGWTIRRLKPEEACDEGDAMGHCVGGYDGDIRDGACGIFSLRDPKNGPHATIEIRPPINVDDVPTDEALSGDNMYFDKDGMVKHHGGQIWQIQGKENQPPIEEYRNRLRDWFGSDSFEERPYIPVEQQDIPIPVDPETLRHYDEPEPLYEDHPYRLGEYEAADYDLDVNDDDRYHYEGAPDWNQIVDNTLNSKFRGRDYRYHAHDARTVAAIARSLNDELDKFQKAVETHRPILEDKFYDTVYNPYSDADHHEQWSNWDRGQIMNTLFGGHSLMRAPDGTESLQNPVPTIHPEQGGLPIPEMLPGQVQYDYGQKASPIYRKEPFRWPYQRTLGPPAPKWYGPLSKVATTSTPIYYRWVFSPKDGQVALGHNDETHPAFVPYHRDIADLVGKANLQHGYAYRIHGGWRLTDEEHKPVRDNYVVAQVVRALNGREEPAEGARKGSRDFSRTHYGLPV